MKLFTQLGFYFCLGLTSVIVYADQTITYTYNLQGQILTEDGPRIDVNDITRYTYDAAGNRATMTNALDHVVHYNAYDGAGHLLSVTDANGIITEFTYSDRGWLLSSRLKHPTNSSLDAITAYTYDAVGQMVSMTLPNGTQLGYEYDNARRLIAIKNAAGERIEYTLDKAGNRTQQVIKNAGGALVYSVAYAFDELSRVMQVAGNHSQITKQQYDANDNNTAQIDGRNNATQQSFDALNRITKVIDPNLKETAFTYDSQNRIKTVTDARKNTTTYNYDGLGNLISQISPDTGTTTFIYDAIGNRTSATDARGIVVNYSYDALNRLTAVTYPAAPSENVTYSYDSTLNGSYGVGRLASIENSQSKQSYVYNNAGLITQKRTHINGQESITAYTYDLAGNISAITYPSGLQVNYVRDTVGRVQAITTQVNAQATLQNVVTNINYLPFGPASSYTYGNGLSHIATYDNDYRLTAIQVAGILERGYSYDPAENILSISNSLAGNKSQTFTYDALNRLTSGKGIYGSQSFSYDAVGNRTGFTWDNGTGLQSDAYTYQSTSNRLLNINKTKAGASVGLRSFNYNASGDITAATSDEGIAQTFDFNNANRLTAANANSPFAASYTYNPLGQRISKAITVAAGTSKELYHYNEAGQLISVTNGAGQVLRDYIYNGNQLVGFVNTSGTNGAIKTLYYVHSDHLGTPQVATAQNQNVVWMADYQPFGKVQPNSGSIELYSRFPGQYVDQETGIYYNYFRDYDPSIGRYIESDPIGLKGGINTYAYVDGNPISFMDPLGLMGYGGGHSTGNPATKPYEGGGPFGLVCGPSGNPIAASWIPDGSKRVEAACQKHDECYSTCGKTQAQCDKEFLKNSWNPIYFGAVKYGGKSAYDDAQKQSGCSCETK